MLTRKLKKTSHNLSIDVFKLVASLFVVFVHVPFPGQAGELVTYIARFAVPSFFAFSGFFSYSVDSDRLGRRMKYLLELMFWGTVLFVVANCVAIKLRTDSMAHFQGDSVSYLKELIPGWWELSFWMLLDVTYFNGALWYLSASLKCYGVLWCYVRFFGEQKPNYQMLYLGGVLLFVLYLVLGVFSQAVGQVTPYYLLRNAVLVGFPMFAMGLFLRQYWELIWNNFQLSPGKLLILILLGIGLSVLEGEMVYDRDVLIGSVFIVVASILLMARYPVLIRNSACIAVAKNCASWSVGVYLVHFPVMTLLPHFVLQNFDISGTLWQWIQPVCVAIVSLILAIVNSAVFSQIRKRIGS